MKTILVTGTSRFWDATAKRYARIVGRTLAAHGFGLVTGNAPGVDKEAADAFCSHIMVAAGDDKTGAANAAREIEERFTQLALRFFRRGSLYPVRGYNAGGRAKRLQSTHEWLDRATALCDAAVMVGGHAGGTVRSALAGGGSLAIVNRFIEMGKPVFPLPFSGGQSDEVFQNILGWWKENPVPGLSRSQFLRLALPWTHGSGDFADLLLGCLAEHKDIFISYRRNDTPWLTWRLHDEMCEHFGTKRVFVDLDAIRGGDDWRTRIQTALEECRVGVIVIGEHWLDRDAKQQRRIDDEGDYVRKEIRTLLERNKRVIVVSAAGAPKMTQDVLPTDLRGLLNIQMLTVVHDTWRGVVDQIIATVKEALLERSSRPSSPHAARIGEEPERDDPGREVGDYADAERPAWVGAQTDALHDVDPKAE